MKIKNKQTGLSLIELMVAVVIGSILLLSLVMTFKSSSDTHRELQKSSDLVENGRYAIDLIFNDVHHAGFYGHFQSDAAYPAALPDPCEIASAANLLAALKVPLQGYASAAGITASSCDEKGLFTADDLEPNNDILVLRRADTGFFAGTNTDATTIVTTGTTVDGTVYLQSNMNDAEVQIATASGIVVDPLNTASGKTATNTTPTLEKLPTKTTDTWADTRELFTHVYYVAQCSAARVCTSTDTYMPTLKRLELSAADSNAVAETRCSAGDTCMNIVPLVEGIEFFKVQYGIDNSPATVNDTTKYLGDGTPDTYITTPTVAQFENVVSVKVSLLARTLEPTINYSDNKSYTVGTFAVAAPGDQFKRNVYSTEVRLNNIAGLREIP